MGMEKAHLDLVGDERESLPMAGSLFFSRHPILHSRRQQQPDCRLFRKELETDLFCQINRQTSPHLIIYRIFREDINCLTVH